MVYIVVIVIFCIGCYLCGGNNNPKKGDFEFVLEFIVLVLLATFRSDEMGGDAISYYAEFDKYMYLSDLDISTLAIGTRLQPLWMIFMACIKSICNNYLFYKFVHAVIVNVSIFSFANNFPKYRFYFLLLFLLLQFWYFEFEIQREILAICIFLYSYKYLIRKKYVTYFIFSVFAFFFHTSAVILVVLPVFYWGITKCFSCKYPYFYLAFIGLLLLSFTLSSYASVLSETFDNNLAAQASTYAVKDINTNGIIKGIIDLVLLFFLLFYVRRKMNIAINYLDIFLLILLFLQILSINIAGMYRFKNYLFLFLLIAAVDTTTRLSRKYVGCKFLMFVFYFYLFASTFYPYSMPTESGKLLLFSFYPYISIFD